MKILAIGDIVGEIGLNKLKEELPIIIDSEKIDFVIVNAENTSGGMGLTIKDFNTLLKMKRYPLCVASWICRKLYGTGFNTNGSWLVNSMSCQRIIF